MRQGVKLIVFSACVVLIATAVGAIMAFYSNKGGELSNVLITKGSSVHLQELFNPEDYWLPGETKQKELNFGNEGERDQVLRFRMELQWQDMDGEIWIPKTENPVQINRVSAFEEEWESFPEDNGWYYYKKVLPAGSETAKVMDSVTFSENLSNDNQGEDFTNTTYRIMIYMEAVNVDSVITAEKWGKTFTGNTSLEWKN